MFTWPFGSEVMQRMCVCFLLFTYFVLPNQSSSCLFERKYVQITIVRLEKIVHIIFVVNVSGLFWYEFMLFLYDQTVKQINWITITDKSDLFVVAESYASTRSLILRKMTRYFQKYIYRVRVYRFFIYSFQNQCFCLSSLTFVLLL